MNTNYKTKQCHIQWLFRNNGYYQITFLQKKKKEKKKNPLWKGRHNTCLKNSGHCSHGKKPQYILNMHYPYPSYTKMTAKTKK